MLYWHEEISPRQTTNSTAPWHKFQKYVRGCHWHRLLCWRRIEQNVSDFIMSGKYFQNEIWVHQITNKIIKRRAIWQVQCTKKILWRRQPLIYIIRRIWNYSTFTGNYCWGLLVFDLMAWKDQNVLWSYFSCSDKNWRYWWLFVVVFPQGFNFHSKQLHY